MERHALPQSSKLRVDLNFRDPIRKSMVPMMEQILGKIIHLQDLNRLYAQLDIDGGCLPFPDRLLSCLGIDYKIPASGFEAIPRSGPLIVVANHPFGAVEGLVLASVLNRVRPDVKIMANYILSRIDELREFMIFVDPFGNPGSMQKNLRPLRQSIEWLRSGGVLAIFPAGEVSHIHVGEAQVTDPKWNSSVARIQRKTGAPVLPVFFRGSNGPLFQALGLLHSKIRTILLPREFLKRRDQVLELEVGSVIPANRLEKIDCDEARTSYLRQRTYLLGKRSSSKSASASAAASPLNRQPRPSVASAVDSASLQHEIDRLDPDQILAATQDLQVFHARADQIPVSLREIGRQREITFRAAGEGSGKELDLDRFDEYYVHLFLWDRARKCIAGGYRIGHADEIVERFGTEGLYTHTLFRFKAGLFKTVGPSLELGRSYVSRDYQRDATSLPLLWKGIARYLSRHARYRNLFGPVSISNDYNPCSKQLIRGFVQAHHQMDKRAAAVRPRNSFRRVGARDWRPELFRNALCEVEDLSEWISEIEPDRKGIPVLLRHYLKLGGRVAAFNVDERFSDVVDALVFVDMTRVHPRLLERLMGRNEAESYLALHETEDCLPQAS